MGVVNRDHSVVGVSLALSVASLVLLFVVTWYFHLSLNLLQRQVEHDRELLLKLQVLQLVYSPITPVLAFHETLLV